MTPVLATGGFSNAPPIQQIPNVNSQEILRKAQEEAKVFNMRISLTTQCAIKFT